MSNQPSDNLIGGTIFWLYIFAAVTISIALVDSLYTLAKNNRSKSQISIQWIKMFSVLAAISFTVLSFNMLQILFNLYNFWVPDQKFDIVPGLNGLLGSIWKWSISSRLFVDPANELTRTPERLVWTRTASMVTLLTSMYFSLDGRRRQVPRLWAYISLLQILPASFAQNLYRIAVLQQGIEPQEPVYPPNSIYMGLIALFINTMIQAPGAADTPKMVLIIFTARAIMLAPIIFAYLPQKQYDRVATNSLDSIFSRACTLIMMAAPIAVLGLQSYSTIQAGSSSKEILAASMSYPAVSTLACDLVLSLISFLVWEFGKRQIRNEE